ncbi:MAG TPA: response regulator transcription factor, partial [Woeseiaceae bacterium]|nr:response regulator transcription factor [Woeseiaceae bacterium]
LADRHFRPETLLAAMSSGADGVILSELSPEAFMQSLRLVSLGEKVLPAQLATLLMDRNLGNPLVPSEVREIGLSEREIDILKLLVGGHSNKAIAIRLDIAEATVKVHVKSVLHKIRVGNRTQAAVWALGHGLTTHDRACEMFGGQ